MAQSLLQKIDRERQIRQDAEPVDAAKMVRITLAEDFVRPLELEWCVGRGHRRTLIILKPGKSVEQPLDKARAWFGPFDLFKVYENTTNERELEGLRAIISTESARFLNRYDYERLAGEGYKPNMTPTGPHRAPDVTITILNSDGSEEDPIVLHEIYGIGKYDDIQFAKRESLEEITARHEAAVATMKAEHQAELNAIVAKFSEQFAEMKGLVKGVLAERKGAAKVAENAKEEVPA